MRHHLPQFSRYLLVGGGAFLIDLGLVLATVHAMPLLWANTLAFAVANLFNFYAGHRFVFRRPGDWATLWPAYRKVLGISLAGLVLSDALVLLLVPGLGLPLALGKAVTAVVVLLWNYIARVHWAYR